MTRWLVGCLAIATACGSSDAEQRAKRAACQAAGDELTSYLRSVDLGPRMFLSRVNLVERSGGAINDVRGYPVQVAIDHVLGPRSDIPIADLHVEIERMNQTHAPRPDDTRAAVAIDAATPWSNVVAVFRELHQAKVDDIDLVVAAPPVKVPPPAPSKVDARLDEISKADESNRATKVAGLMRDLTSSCPALIKLFGRVGSEEGGSKTEILIGGIPAALVECECDLDIDSFRAVFYRILHDDHPIAGIAIQLRPGARKLRIAPTTPWRDVVPMLTPGPIDPAQ